MATVTMIDDFKAEIAQNALGKIAAITVAKEGLAEAKQIWENAGLSSDAATAIASQAVIGLANCRCIGTASAEEVSSLLGGIFGYVPKKDGTPGKTPAGKGQDIRKRIVRTVEAYPLAQAFKAGVEVENDQRPTWAQNADLGEIASIVDAVLEGTTSIWTGYDAFTETGVRDPKLDSAFSADFIVKLANKLLSNPSALVDNLPLIKAYAHLHAAVDEAAKYVPSQKAA